jgi:hypothetical protein
MPDLDTMSIPMAAATHEADARCRGTGTTSATAGAAPSSIPADAPVGRPVVREAVRLAAAEAVTQEVHDRVAGLRRVGAADVAVDVAVDAAATPGEPVEGPSPELVRLLAHLRSAVTRYAQERRDAGAAVERIVPEVKCLVREAASCEGWFDPGDSLMAQVVRWTIMAYYDQPELAHAPRFY